tara:strand:+ start:35464 stop:35868 length:405 start_codon:yes stop_codon:yes gene_type:complete
MKTIYLCGPINGCTDDEAHTWRERVKEYAATIATPRFETRDPMDRDYRGKEGESIREIVDLDKRDVRESHVVLVNYSKPSVGTAMEILYAWQMGTPVIIWARGGVTLSPWLVYHSTAIVHTFVDAMEAVERAAA